MAFFLTHVHNIGIQRNIIHESTTTHLKNTKLIFEELQKLDIKMLSSTLEVIIQDPVLKKIYLEQDRDTLYEYAAPLFTVLKEQYDITHWYFIQPDGHTFLRMHDQALHGDEITRFTLWQAQDTKSAASGIELGKTAYALRVVKPYIADGKLIGYVELSKEIDHFLDILQGETDNDFVFVADKRYLDREKWASVKQTAGSEDNWDDMDRYVVVSDHAGQDQALECFSEENMQLGERGQTTFGEFRQGDTTFRCVGIDLIDAGDRQSGLLLSLIDMSDDLATTREYNQTIFIFSAAALILIALISLLVCTHYSFKDCF